MLVRFFPIFCLPLFQLNIHILSWHHSLKYWKKHCLRQSLRNYGIVYCFWIRCPFLPSFHHLPLFVFPLYPWRQLIYMVVFSLVGLSLPCFCSYLLPLIAHASLRFFDLAAPVQAILCPVSFFHPSITPSNSCLTLVAVLTDISIFRFSQPGVLPSAHICTHRLCICNLYHKQISEENHLGLSFQWLKCHCWNFCYTLLHFPLCMFAVVSRGDASFYFVYSNVHRLFMKKEDTTYISWKCSDLEARAI